MTKAKYTSEVLIQNGKIRRSTPFGLDNARDDQRVVVNLIKPIMYAWLKSKIESNPGLENSEVLVRSKYTETTNGLTVEFKVQSVVPIG